MNNDHSSIIHIAFRLGEKYGTHTYTHTILITVICFRTFSTHYVMQDQTCLVHCSWSQCFRAVPTDCMMQDWMHCSWHHSLSLCFRKFLQTVLCTIRCMWLIFSWSLCFRAFHTDYVMQDQMHGSLFMVTMFQGIPYRLYAGSDTRLIVHLSLCGLGLLLAIITFIVQLVSPAPYGKHENKVF